MNPDATVQVIFTGDWSLPVREAEATNALIDAGCDVITCHVDSPKVVIQTAEGRGVMTCGHNASQAPLAPKASSPAPNTSGDDLPAFADALAKGEPLPNFTVRRLPTTTMIQQHGLRRRRKPPRRSRPPTPPSKG